MGWANLLISAAAGAVFGLLAGALRDRLRRRNRHEGVARALMADVDRIREELGEPKDRYVEVTFYGAGPETPEIHTWVHELIAESAEISGDLVREFLRLDRSLANFALSVRKLREARRVVRTTKEELEQARTSKPRPFAREMALERRLEKDQSQVEFWHDSVVDDRKRAWKYLGNIEGLLKPYA